jgi:hypothetical protein
MAKARQLKLGHMIEGAGRTWTDWRHPDAEPGASTNFAYYKRRAQLAESARFDFVFIADSLFITHTSSPHTSIASNRSRSCPGSRRSRRISASLRR